MKKSIMYLRALVGVTLAMAAQGILAFSYPSHAVVCDLAYQYATPETQRVINGLVRQSGEARSFAQLCGWPDRVRKIDDYKHTSVWHYINVARKDISVHRAHCPGKGCVTEEIRAMQKRLQRAPGSDWQALAFLGHFVGDVHQPLHVSYADDRGGNQTRIYYRGERTNLHAFWDRDVPGLSGTLAKDSALIASFPVKASAEESPEDWADESLQKTRDIYRDYKKGARFDDADISADRQWIRSRLNLAARRLASLLDQLLDTSAAE
jgi:hypothetical protein